MNNLKNNSMKSKTDLYFEYNFYGKSCDKEMNGIFIIRKKRPKKIKKE